MSILKTKLREYYEEMGDKYGSPEDIGELLDFFSDLYETEEETNDDG